MKNMIILFAIFSIGGTAFWSVNNSVNPPSKKLTLDEALKKGMITASVKGKGGYQGNCIFLEIKNNTNIDTTFWMEPGRRLDNLDSTCQDILVVKEIPLFAKAGGTITSDVYGFCCQASNGPPRVDQAFSIGKMADSSLTKLARYLNSHKFPDNVMQNAIWVISNDHAIASIHSADPSIKKDLQNLHKYVASLKNLPIDFSWYTLTYQTDTTRLFSGVADSLFGTYDYELWNPAQASLILYNSHGKIMERFFVNKPHNPDKYSFEIKMSVTGWPKGKYFVRLFGNDQKKSERVFEV